MDEQQKMNVTGRITDILSDMGIAAHLKGFHYLRYGILTAYSDFKRAQSVTKYLYPTIATEFGTTAPRVERAIRHAIELACDTNGDNVRKHLKCNTPAKYGKFVNSQFIMILADRLLREDGILPTV